MVMIQKLKEAEITERDSLLLTRTLLRIAIFNISYIQGLFPENYFKDKSVPALNMMIKKLLPIDAESRRLLDWMEKGVYDALQRKYLKTLMFCICESVDGPMIEEYSFSFSYSDSDSQDVKMNISRTGTTKQGGIFNSTPEITTNQMRSSACKMSRTLVQLMRILDKWPDKRTIVMKLMYYDDVTPKDYEPPFFRGCKEEEAQHVWTEDPLRMEVGNVNSKHLVLTLKVNSVLDPCEDEDDDMQDGGKTIGPDSVHDDQPSDPDSEISQMIETQFLLAPVEKQDDDDDGEVDEDDTQDSVESQQQLARVKDSINSRHLDTVEPEVGTRGGIHSIGSDLARTKERSLVQQNGPVPSEQTISKANTTPVSIFSAQVASRESFAVKGMADTKSSQASQGKRYRKTSMVRDPILQQSKRQKAYAN